MGWGHFDGLKPSQHVWSSCTDKKPLCQPKSGGKQKEGPVPVRRCWETRCREGVVMVSSGFILGLDTTSVNLCSHGFVCLAGGRAQDCPGTAEIPKSFVLGWIRDLKSSDMYFFNTHNSVVWCLVNSCLTAELTAAGFTHPLEMLKLEKKI